MMNPQMLTAVSRPYASAQGTYNRYYCPQCDMEILNFHSRTPFYQCEHSPWGTRGQKPTDREVLDRVLSELQTIKALLRGPE